MGNHLQLLGDVTELTLLSSFARSKVAFIHNEKRNPLAVMLSSIACEPLLLHCFFWRGGGRLEVGRLCNTW